MPDSGPALKLVQPHRKYAMGTAAITLSEIGAAAPECTARHRLARPARMTELGQTRLRHKATPESRPWLTVRA